MRATPMARGWGQAVAWVWAFLLEARPAQPADEVLWSSPAAGMPSRPRAGVWAQEQGSAKERSSPSPTGGQDSESPPVSHGQSRPGDSWPGRGHGSGTFPAHRDNTESHGPVPRDTNIRVYVLTCSHTCRHMPTHDFTYNFINLRLQTPTPGLVAADGPLS